MIALPMGLILLEPDLGSSIVFIPVGLAMMFLAGIPRSYLIRLLLAASAMVLLVLLDALFFPRLMPVFQLEDYQTNRIRVYLGMPFASADATPNEKRRADLEERKFTYNVDQALISVGSGGWSGKGWCEGTQNALGYLPKKVAHNDFIFSVIAEEWGFLGSIAVVVLHGVILAWFFIAQARDGLGRVLAIGQYPLVHPCFHQHRSQYPAPARDGLAFASAQWRLPAISFLMALGYFKISNSIKETSTYSESTQGNRRRSGVRFKPSTGVGPKTKSPEGSCRCQGRAIENVTSDDEPVFDESRHSRELTVRKSGCRFAPGYQ